MSAPELVFQDQQAAFDKFNELLAERVDYVALLTEAGVDLTGFDNITVEWEGNVAADGDVAAARRCHRICVGYGKLKVCYTTCG